MRLDADRRDDGRRQLIAARQAMMAKRGIRDRLQAWKRSLSDPLRNAPAATRWISSLPAGDALQLQREALELVASFPGTRRNIGPSQAEALLRIDERVAPMISQLTSQYVVNYQRSTSVETRLWHGVFDLVKAFIAAYQAALKAGMVGEPRRWKSVLPALLTRLAHYKCIDGKFRLFRYGHWIPAQWRDLHEFYELARMRGWQREAFSLPGASEPGVTLEHEYIKVLLLMRLDSGSFTPDQVEWVACILDEWVTPLALTPPPGTGANFYVDISGTQGLKRADKPRAGGRLMFLDTAPVYARVVERMRVLPEQQDQPLEPGELPAREQKLLLMRLAALYGPEALAYSPRAPRKAADVEVRVVVGLQALTRAVAEVGRVADGDKTSDARHSFDEITQMVSPTANPDSVARRVRGSQWRVVDKSETGCRLIAPSSDAPTSLGEMIAFRDVDGWSLAIVRRMQRQQVDEVICGVEIVARRMVRVLLRNWTAPLETSRASVDRPFFGLYLPGHADNRQASQRSLIGPDQRFTPGAMVELDTGNARYLIRFTQTIERQAGWAWAMFTAVRKLSG
ncbi:MAG TPA: hypothetical protein VGH59_02120 [Casimicrobiaceae bacterium]|jgi:hypothetical protein